MAPTTCFTSSTDSIGEHPRTHAVTRRDRSWPHQGPGRTLDTDRSSRSAEIPPSCAPGVSGVVSSILPLTTSTEPGR